MRPLLEHGAGGPTPTNYIRHRTQQLGISLRATTSRHPSTFSYLSDPLAGAILSAAIPPDATGIIPESSTPQFDFPFNPDYSIVLIPRFPAFPNRCHG